MKYTFILVLVILAGCTTNNEIKTITVQKEYPPHIWSDHKLFNGSIEMCASKGKSILESLGFIQVVRNGNFIYGNFSNNRAVIKCALVEEGVFVYAAVAGPKVKLVEKLRNEIVWQL